MKIIDSTDSLKSMPKGCALTIGNFDGVHLGHADIIAVAKKAKQDYNAGDLALMTFDPHPVAILHPERTPEILTPRAVKHHLLAQLGVDTLIIIRDSYDLLNLSPEDFVDRFLIKNIAPKVVIEGPNFNFGYGRSGTIETLKTLAKERHFDVVVAEGRNIELSDNSTQMCSSSMIRDRIENGKIKDAAKALGRYYRLIGRTVKGRGIGTSIGFPTANIEPVEQLIPAEGVYAGFVAIANNSPDAAASTQKHHAIFSIGRAKTFITDHPLLLEAHILEPQVENLYGKWLALDFVEKIRNQKRFPDHKILTRQIEDDCQKAKNILANL